MSRQERKLDAAEYVIGTLSSVERHAFEASIENNADTRADVQFWERAFGALNASISPEIPPKTIWARIEGALPAQGFDDAKSVGSDPKNPISVVENALPKLKRSRGRWRMGAIAASLAALGLGGFIANERYKFIPASTNGNQSAKEFTAVVNAEGGQPSLIVNVNAKTGEVSVRSMGITPPEGKSLELWFVAEGQKPVSVGLVGEGPMDFKGAVAKGGETLAISVEPRGGSPIGKSTGPVIYRGKLTENAGSK